MYCKSNKFKTYQDPIFRFVVNVEVYNIDLTIQLVNTSQVGGFNKKKLVFKMYNTFEETLLRLSCVKLI